ncbi:hypothetical protein KFK09_018682 [Dendrobium nobile]|uniref:Uncharacterized protein n=1 Tax=Dendrobium nobile TaxID=94219 RepID=A0A8T3AVY6_DENNO|nr:hypothetical protein KFK09_018682 [Dendrobium nobile]
MGSFLFNQYQVVGRALPAPSDEHSKNHRLKLWATVELKAKSKFWCFPRKLKKVKKSNDQVLAINEDPGEYQNALNSMAYYLRSNLQCRVCGFRGRRKHFKLFKVPHKASLIQRLQTLFSASPKILSSYILLFQRKVQKVTCWQEKFIISIGSIFSCVVVSMMLIISASVTVSKDSTYMAIKKMLSTLDDPFTRFLEPEKFKVLRAVWHSRCTDRCRFIDWLSHRA